MSGSQGAGIARSDQERVFAVGQPQGLFELHEGGIEGLCGGSDRIGGVHGHGSFQVREALWDCTKPTAVPTAAPAAAPIAPAFSMPSGCPSNAEAKPMPPVT